MCWLLSYAWRHRWTRHKRSYPCEAGSLWVRTKLMSKKLTSSVFLSSPRLPIFVDSWFEWLPGFRTVHQALPWVSLCTQLWQLPVDSYLASYFWASFRPLGAAWAALLLPDSLDSGRGCGFSDEMDQASGFKITCMIMIGVYIPPPKLLIPAIPLTQTSSKQFLMRRSIYRGRNLWRELLILAY